MKYSDLLEETQKEMLEEKKEIAKSEIKDKLIEIEYTRNVLKEMEKQLEDFLKEEI